MAWKTSKAYSTTPSELYFITDEVAAWSFNRAVHLFGSSLEAELDQASRGAKTDAQANSKRSRVLAKWLGGKQQFRDPVSSGSGNVSSTGSGPVAL